MELRYNNQAGTLGSLPLTSGGTTITFAVAPNFATLTTGQFIKLVLDAGQSTFEIVYLTAYTVAATTGTITRAAEDSTLWPAVAHTSTSGPSGGAATWACVPTATGQDYPGEFLIASQVLASPAASVTFSSIPSTYNHLRLVAVGRSSDAVEADVVYLQFNADTAAHYDTALFYPSSNTSASFEVEYGIDQIWASDFPGTSATANLPGMCIMDIPAYAGTTFEKFVQMAAGYMDAVAGSSPTNVWAAFGVWRSTAAINAIKLFLASGDNFVTGSSFYLYGVT